MTIIAFISQKGGVGKSTLSQALAVEAKKQKINVIRAPFKVTLFFSRHISNCEFFQNTFIIDKYVVQVGKELQKQTENGFLEKLQNQI